MSTPAENLAKSLEILRELQTEKGLETFRSRDISRTHRDRLIKNGFLKEVIKGWYIPTRPDEKTGESTSWYASFWHFCSNYLDERFSDEWCVSPEQSIAIHSGNWTVPSQLFVRSSKGNNNLIKLPFGTSIFDAKLSIPEEKDIVVKDKIRIYSLPLSLILCSERFYLQSPNDIRSALRMIKDSSELLPILLSEGQPVVAGRIAGAFRNLGRKKIADDIINTMKAAGYTVRETDPFFEKLPVLLSGRELSPYATKLRLMWQKMRNVVIDNFPEEPGRLKNITDYLRDIDDIFKTDAYHSLSIEGYRVSPELIEKVRHGRWKPDIVREDIDQKNALAARGYWQAFKLVKVSIKKILKNQNPGMIVYRDHGAWYRDLFGPSVIAGILKPSDLAGYRNNQVIISQSRHIPPNPESVRDAMPVLFELLEGESESSVRSVLGHFIFVYIHPYPDGNGRIARFIMNAMLASGGYPWTIIPVEKREKYMSALEKASVEQDIAAFTRFLGELVSNGMK